MFHRSFTAAAVLLASISSVAGAAPPLILYPQHVGAETARYDRGLATISLRSPTATIEIRPLPIEKGQVAFSIAVFNHGPRPANLGIENISALVNGIPMPLPTYAQLADDAERRARNAKIGTALFAGVLAGVASTASTEGTYYRHVRGPGGSHTQAIHWHDDTPGIIGATAAVVGGAVVIHGIDRKLDYTLAQLGAQILQTTTVDPDSSFGGMVVLPLGHRTASPADIRITIRFDGRPYMFAFRLAPAGMAIPADFPATTRADLIAPAMMPPADMAGDSGGR